MCSSASLHHRFTPALLQQKGQQASSGISLGPLKILHPNLIHAHSVSLPISLPACTHLPHTRRAICTSHTAGSGIAGLRWPRPLDSTHHGGAWGGSYLRSWCSRFSLLLAPTQDVEMWLQPWHKHILFLCVLLPTALASSGSPKGSPSGSYRLGRRAVAASPSAASAQARARSRMAASRATSVRCAARRFVRHGSAQ